MLRIEYTSKFKKDIKLMYKRGYKSDDLKSVIDYLVRQEPLPQKYCDHELSGKYTGFRECHIKPDWLLIYQIYDDILILSLSRTGTHSDLFR